MAAVQLGPPEQRNRNHPWRSAVGAASALADSEEATPAEEAANPMEAKVAANGLESPVSEIGAYHDGATVCASRPHSCTTH